MEKLTYKVTPELLDIALRLIGIRINIEKLDKIIDIIEVMKENGENTSLNHIAKLEKEWLDKEMLSNLSNQISIEKEITEAFTQ